MVLIELLHDSGVDGTIRLYYLNSGEGLSRRNDARFQRLASRPGVQVANHRRCDRNVTQC